MKILEYHPNDKPADDKLRFSFWEGVDYADDNTKLRFDDLRMFETAGAQTLVYWYEAGAYEGSGDAYWQDSDGNWHYHNLSHCSCYGPVERIVRDTNPLTSLLDADPDAFETYETAKMVLVNYIKMNFRAISKITGISF